MATVVIDLYDSGILISDGDQVLVESTTCALIESDKSISVGESAKQQARIRPREINTQFWSQLSANSDTKHVISNAEIAFKHLQYVWKQLTKQDYEALIATSDTLSKQDLGLLLGICEKLSISVSGIVSKGVLAVRGPVANCKLVYIDVMQQQIAITEIKQNKTGISVVQPSTVLTHGLQTLITNLAKSISDQFISKTRFDPMHIAEDEQLLYERLPDWVKKLETTDSVDCELTSGINHYSIDLHRKHLLNKNQLAFNAIASCLNDLSQEQQAVAIICSPVCAQIFGLLDYLKALPGCAVLALDQNSIAKQALINKEQICAKNSQIHYTTSLTWDKNADPLKLEFSTGSLAKLDRAPTHVLANNHAHPLIQEVFITKNNEGKDFTISNVCSEESICKISTKGLVIKIENLNGYVIKLNDSALKAGQSVQIGDRLRIEGHKNELHFIKVT